jgi:hypothetical protein
MDRLEVLSGHVAIPPCHLKRTDKSFPLQFPPDCGQGIHNLEWLSVPKRNQPGGG